MEINRANKKQIKTLEFIQQIAGSLIISNDISSNTYETDIVQGISQLKVDYDPDDHNKLELELLKTYLIRILHAVRRLE